MTMYSVTIAMCGGDIECYICLRVILYTIIIILVIVYIIIIFVKFACLYILRMHRLVLTTCTGKTTYV